MSLLAATNVPASGQECPCERPRMSLRAATNVPASGQECPCETPESSDSLQSGQYRGLEDGGQRVDQGEVIDAVQFQIAQGVR
jgi:hypothetical protein